MSIYDTSMKEFAQQAIALMIQCQVHIGTKNVQNKMKKYVFKRTVDGVNIIDLRHTYEKLLLAARILVTIENPNDILVVSSREFGKRPILKFSQYIGANALPTRWTPGTLTNHNNPKFLEPRILLIADPSVDNMAIKEAGYANVPVIALCDTDCHLQNVDLAIPCNCKGRESIACIFWFLTKEYLALVGTIPRIHDPLSDKNPIFVDSFVWKEPELNANEKQYEGSSQNQPRSVPTIGDASISNDASNIMAVAGSGMQGGQMYGEINA